MQFANWSLAVVSLAMIGCAKKPQPVRSEPLPPVVAMSEPPKAEPAPVEDMRARIQALINKAFQAVYFPFDQATLSKQSMDILSEAGKLMKQEPAIKKVLIQGNADERGTPEYNLALGEKRAQTVKAYLTNYGVEAGRLTIISYGEEKPAQSGHDEGAWAMNRRSDFEVDF